MRNFLRILSIVVSAFFVFGLAQTGVLSSLDNILERQRLEVNNRAPSGDVVLVEIDSTSLSTIDTWPWPRTIYADLLDRLMEMGADEVAFDIDFSSRSTEEHDAALEAALDRAGGYAYLAAFEQVSGITGQLQRAMPLDRFSDHADPVIVNVILDQWGMVRSVPLQAIGGDPVPAIAWVLGRSTVDFPQTTPIDFSIDLSAIDRFPVVDVLAGDVGADRIAGKRVVVGASAIELRDFFTTPRFGIIPGPLVQIAATETVIAGRVLKPVSTWQALILVIAIGLLALMAHARFELKGSAGVVVVAGLGVEAAALILFGSHAIVVDTGIFHAANLLFLLLAIIQQASIWWTQRQTMQARLQHLARYDEISGARSRYGFLEKLQADIHDNNPMVVLVIEVHRLDAIRGALGDGIASATLREITTRLDTVVPGYVGRIGDERFAVGLRSRNTGQIIRQVSEQVNFSLNEPFDVDSRMVHIEVELAGASVAEAGESAADLLGFAELSLGRSDQGNSFGATLYDPIFAEQLSRRRQLDLDMRSALAEDRFGLAMQPQVDLATRKLLGVEALIRWNHPEFGFIPPPELIELAEETGFILDIGRWVLNKACSLSAGWNWKGRIAVNVSPLQIEMGDLVADVRAALSASGLAASQLELEVTESVMSHEQTQAGETLKMIRRMGTTVALDDFGTGYSSLSYIHTLPFDVLKIDRSFVLDLQTNPERRAVVESIIGMAKKLGKIILVEGVETADQHNLVRALGCDLGQGYFYGKPVDAGQLTAALTRRRA